MSPTPRSHPGISPELALVDPELRRVAQLLLPDRGSFVRVADPKAVSVVETAQRPEAAVVRQSRRRAWTRRVLLLAPAAAAAVVVTSPSAVGLRTPEPTLVNVDASTLGIPPTRQADWPAEHVRAEPLRAATPKPRIARKQPRPQKVTPRSSLGTARTPVPVRTARLERPKLSWRAVAGASYYNVIVWRKGERVLDLWPARNRALLPGSWTSKGVSRTLSPGRYLWFVYPGFGARADARYGEPVQSGILVIDRK